MASLSSLVYWLWSFQLNSDKFDNEKCIIMEKPLSSESPKNVVDNTKKEKFRTKINIILTIRN